MDTHPYFVEARRVKKQHEDTLSDINNKISSLASLGNDLKTQVETHFTALEEALSARKAVLLQNLNGKIASVGANLELMKMQATVNLSGCVQMINVATQFFVSSPELVGNLQSLRALFDVNAVLPLMKIVFSSNTAAIIQNEGEILSGELTTIAGSSTTGSQNGAKSGALFSSPCGIAYDAKEGVCYVADTRNHKIRKVTSSGEVTTFGSSEVGFIDGSSAVGKFNSPYGVAVHNATGDVYVCDSGNHRIQKITPKGVVSTFAGTGSVGSVDGLGVSTSFSSPWRIDINQTDGCLYIVDQGNHRIRKITPQGVVSTVCGTSAGFADGNVANATFNSPTGLAVDTTTGDIYVADYGNHKIRKISAGTVTTLAGIVGPGDVDRAGTEAKFTYPWDVKINYRDGSLLVADHSNNKIRKISKQGVVSTVQWPEGGGVSSAIAAPRALSIDDQNNLCYIVHAHQVSRVFIP